MASDGELNILCAANETYVMPLAVMLTSVVCNLKEDCAANIYILESDIKEPLRQKIEASIRMNRKAGHRLSFHWLRVDIARFKLYFKADHLQYMAPDCYSRLLAAEILPASCDQVIYLDCDVVVLADLANLAAVDGRFPVAAVSGVWCPYVSSEIRGRSMVFNYQELGISPSNRYFQSGVLVMNLKLWRERGITRQLLEYLAKHWQHVVLHDQGVLNAVLHDQWFRLDQRWNQTTTVLYPEQWCAPAYSREEWLKTRDDPFIVHYDGPDKPWNPGFHRPRADFFRRYLKKTLFAEDCKAALAHRVERILGFKNYFRLWRLRRALASNR